MAVWRAALAGSAVACGAAIAIRAAIARCTASTALIARSACASLVGVAGLGVEFVGHWSLLGCSDLTPDI